MSKTNTTKKKSPQMPWIQPASCEGCGACVMQCPTNCLKMVKTGRQGVEVAWIRDPDQCIGCGQCARVCGMGALSMTRYTGMAKERFQKVQPESYGAKEENQDDSKS